MLTDTHCVTCRQQMDRDVNTFKKMKQSKKEYFRGLAIDIDANIDCQKYDHRRTVVRYQILFLNQLNVEQKVKSLEVERSEVIPKLIKDITELKKKYENLPVGHQCCFFLGITGSGKSTTICYLCGAKMKSYPKWGKYVIEHDQRDRFPDIGNTAASCTEVAKFYPLNGSQNVLLYDPPGFQDTKGNHQQILNSYSNAKMFKIGSKARIIIIVEHSSLLSGKGDHFVNVARRLRELFNNDFEHLIKSCFLVITKVNPSQEKYIPNIIKEISENNMNLGPEGVMLFQSLREFNRIAYFLTPDKIKQEDIERMKSRILEVPCFHISNEPNIALSAESKNCIKDILDHLEQSNIPLIRRICDEINERMEQKNLKRRQEVEFLFQQYRSAKNMLDSDLLISVLPNKLAEFGEILQIRRQDLEKIKEWFSQIQFCLTIYPSIRLTQTVKQYLSTAINSCINKVELALSRITSRQEMEFIQAQNQENMRRQIEKYQAEISNINRVNDARIAEISQNARRENEENRRRMQSDRRQYAEDMRRMNQRLSQVRNPQIIERRSGCTLI